MDTEELVVMDTIVNNISSIPNSTMDSLILNRVVSIDLFNVGILILIISIVSVILFAIVMDYLKHNK